MTTRIPAGHVSSTNPANADYSALPFEEPSIPVTDHFLVNQPNAQTRQSRLISPCSAFMIFLLLARLAYGIIVSQQKLYAILFAFLAIAPASFVAWWALRAFRDGSLQDSFIVSQFLMGAVPLVLVAFFVEVVLTFVSVLPVISALPKDALEKLKNVFNATGEPVNDDTMKDLIPYLRSTPTWAIVLTIFMASFLVAGAVEEVGKWLFARRFQVPMREAADEGRYFGAHGILLSAAMVSLGFAMMENIGYLLGMSTVASSGFPFMLVSLGILRGLLAFPVHVGAQLHVAVAAANKHVFGDGTRVFVALIQAIVFHGTFDGVAMTSMALVMLEKIPSWTMLLVPLIDIFMVVVLLLLVKSRYSGVLERERVARSEPV